MGRRMCDPAGLIAVGPDVLLTDAAGRHDCNLVVSIVRVDRMGSSRSSKDKRVVASARIEK